MNRLCTVCARGGSKGVPNKNIRHLNGKPLILYTLDCARAAGLFEKIAVSSDSDEILKVAEEEGADLLIKRPDELATDTAPKIPVIQHSLLEAECKLNKRFDVICDLDPTSPFRTAEDIRRCVELLEMRKVSNVITGAPARKSPYFNMVELDEKGVARLVKQSLTGRGVARRQDAPLCYDMNASIYVWWRQTLLTSESVFLKDTVLYEMPRERSIEIDTEFDFRLATWFVTKGVFGEE